MWAFWRAVFDVAVTRAKTHETNTKFGGKILTALSTVAFPAVATWWDAPIPAALQAAPFLLYFFVWAPSKVWSIERKEVEHLTDRLTPKIALSATVMEIWTSRMACIKVRNEGIDQLRNCTAQLLSRERLISGSWLAGEGVFSVYLRWSVGDPDARSRTFQSVAYVQVASINRPHTAGIDIQGVTGEIAASLDDGIRWRLTIEIAADNSAPVTRRFEVWVDHQHRVGTAAASAHIQIRMVD